MIDLIENLRGLGAHRHSDASVALDAIEEIYSLRDDAAVLAQQVADLTARAAHFETLANTVELGRINDQSELVRLTAEREEWRRLDADMLAMTKANADLTAELQREREDHKQANEAAALYMREAEVLRADYEGACKLVADMHAAAMGAVVGPTLGVVEDVAALRADAERWAWWRTNFGQIVVHTEWKFAPEEGRYVVAIMLEPNFGPINANSVDSAVDAARGKP